MHTNLKYIFIFLAFSFTKAFSQSNDSILKTLLTPGQLITCRTDPGTLLVEDTIRIYYPNEKTKDLELNLFCPNFPKGDTLKHHFMWPASIEFAEELYFTFKYDRKQKQTNNGDMSVIYDDSKYYLGQYTLDESKKILQLRFTAINWKERFSYSYSKKTRTLTLIKLASK